MDTHDLIIRLRTVAAKAFDLKQHEAAREIEALITKMAAKYYFLVNPGGHGSKIPDKEYVEFPDEETVVQYVRDTLLSELSGRKPGENEGMQQEVDFQRARQMLLEVGEFGPLGTPLTPPDAMVGSREARAPRDLADFKDQLKRVVTEGKMEIIEGVSIDTDKAALLLKFLAVINPAFAPAAMAMGMASLLHVAYQWAEKAGDFIWGEDTAELSMAASTERYADFEVAQSELHERFDRWKYDPRLLGVVSKIIRAMTTEGRARMMAKQLPEMIDQAMGTFKDWQTNGEGQELEAFVKERESSFFKEVKPPKPVPEEWEKSFKR